MCLSTVWSGYLLRGYNHAAIITEYSRQTITFGLDSIWLSYELLQVNTSYSEFRYIYSKTRLSQISLFICIFWSQP